MSEITIPPEAVEAGCSAYTAVIYRGNGTTAEFRQAITAAIRATLAAWPGIAVNDGCPVWHAYPHITLPLPQEPSDDMA